MEETTLEERMSVRPFSDFGTTTLTAVVPAVWGTTYVVTTELLPPDRPLLAATLRALPVGLLLLAATRSLPRGTWWWRSGVLGVLNIGLFFGLLFLAAYRLPGGLAATLVSTTPLLVVGLSWPLLGVRPTRTSLAAGTLGVAGVALLVLRPDARLDAVGAGAAVAAALAFAFGIVLTKRWGRPGGLLAFTAWQLVAGGLALAPFALAIEGAPPALDSDAILGFAYLGLVGTGLAYVLWFRGIARLAATRVSLLGLFSPLVAVLIGVAFARERFGAAEAAGIALVLAGVLLGQRLPRTARPIDDAGPAPSVLAHRTSDPEKELRMMRITVFGAAGSVGSRVVAEALSRGHDVTAVVRDPARFHELPAAARARAGDAANIDDVAELSAGQDVVISATRPPAGSEDELVRTARALLAGVARTDVRLLVVGGAGSLTVPGTGGRTVIDDPDHQPAAAYRDLALACTDQLEVCRAEDGVNWAYLSPAAHLAPGERTGHYRLGTDELLVDANGNSTISVEDLAVALLDETERADHRRSRFTAAY